MKRFNPKVHHRRSIRLQGYDYAQAGAYFVTIVTWHRECLFGEIVNGEMRLNPRGQIADECWQAIPEHFHNVELGLYVIMPNHVHGIVVIHDTDRRNPTQKDLATQLRGHYQQSYEHTKPPSPGI